MSKKNVIALELNHTMKSRIKDLCHQFDYEVHITGEAQDLMPMIKRLGYRVDLLLLSISSTSDLDIIKQIKEDHQNLPIILLTENSKRYFLIEALKTGIDELLLKPFHDELLLKKVKPFLEIDHITLLDNITFNLHRYLKSELRKAQKGSYPLALLLGTIANQSGEVHEALKDEYYYVTKALYQHFLPLFWDTDIFIRFGDQYFIGVFPFCDAHHAKVIEDKIQLALSESQGSDKRLAQYGLHNVYAFFPQDADTPEAILAHLVTRLKALRPIETDQLTL